ncbi:type II toxin-antitoxin system RelE/ParE family toxin [Geomesophilobacter sediminis]|uniref:Type II toxin-antitoxin system RelE/ParE family toxin n=1 Tax=Geomesophilobacter sediminis TaxID=2798584 RepID=A0A8J7JD31_9BACT|nr:type II toxin-antitoxin system RelE/ParE family toxin [Geomesophilobacter sediminis]
MPDSGSRTKYEVTFHPEAIEDYAEAFEWYAERAEHLAESFEREFDRSFELLVEAPHRWLSPRRRTGRVLLRRFPFAIICRIGDAEIVIMAVAHHGRRHGYWKHRS